MEKFGGMPATGEKSGNGGNTVGNGAYNLDIESLMRGLEELNSQAGAEATEVEGAQGVSEPEMVTFEVNEAENVVPVGIDRAKERGLKNDVEVMGEKTETRGTLGGVKIPVESIGVSGEKLWMANRGQAQDEAMYPNSYVVTENEQGEWKIVQPKGTKKESLGESLKKKAGRIWGAAKGFADKALEAIRLDDEKDEYVPVVEISRENMMWNKTERILKDEFDKAQKEFILGKTSVDDFKHQLKQIISTWNIQVPGDENMIDEDDFWEKADNFIREERGEDVVPEKGEPEPGMEEWVAQASAMNQESSDLDRKYWQREISRETYLGAMREIERRWNELAPESAKGADFVGEAEKLADTADAARNERERKNRFGRFLKKVANKALEGAKWLWYGENTDSGLAAEASIKVGEDEALEEAENEADGEMSGEPAEVEMAEVETEETESPVTETESEAGETENGAMETVTVTEAEAGGVEAETGGAEPEEMMVEEEVTEMERASRTEAEKGYDELTFAEFSKLQSKLEGEIAQYQADIDALRQQRELARNAEEIEKIELGMSELSRKIFRAEMAIRIGKEKVLEGQKNEAKKVELADYYAIEDLKSRKGVLNEFAQATGADAEGAIDSEYLEKLAEWLKEEYYQAAMEDDEARCNTLEDAMAKVDRAKLAVERKEDADWERRFMERVA